MYYCTVFGSRDSFTIPHSSVLTGRDRFQVGAWRDRIVLCMGKQGPPATVVKAFLEAGAKAVIVSAVETDMQAGNGGDGLTPEGRRHAEESNDAGRFVIGEEDEDAYTEESSPESDWEDSDFEREKHMERQEVEERDLAAFAGVIYDALFRQGLGVDTGLRLALEAHPKQHYKCILPTV